MATREQFRKRIVPVKIVKEFCKKCVAVMPHTDTGLKFIICQRCHTPRDRRA